MPPKITLDQIMQAVEADEGTGFCIRCGFETMGVEPDAERYECTDCGEMGVYGAFSLLLRVSP